MAKYIHLQFFKKKYLYVRIAQFQILKIDKILKYSVRNKMICFLN